MEVDRTYQDCFYNKIKEIKKEKKGVDDRIKEIKLNILDDEGGYYRDKSFTISFTYTNGEILKGTIFVPQNKLLNNNCTNVLLRIKELLNSVEDEKISPDLFENAYEELFVNARIDKETDKIISNIYNIFYKTDGNCYIDLIKHFITSPEDNKDLLSNTNLYKYLMKINDHKIIDNFYKTCKKLNYDVKQIAPLSKIQRDFFDLVKNNIPLLKVYIENDLCSEFKTPFNENFLQFSIRTNNWEMFDYLIHLDPAPFDYSEATLWGDTPLHTAAGSTNPDFIKILLKDKRFTGQEQIKNLYGLTPIDFATCGLSPISLRAHEENKEIISLLEPLYKSHVIRNKPKRIDQVTLQEKFSSYLKVEKRPNIEQILSSGGMCNGLSFLHLFYATQGKEDFFYNILEDLCSWDGKEESLNDKPQQLPEYASRRELFEQFLNDISVFQCSSGIINELKNQPKSEFYFMNQNSRKQQYDLVKNKESNITDVSYTNSLYYDYVDLAYLTQILQLLCLEPNSSLLIHGSAHAISVQINKDGSYSYYDPNLNFRPIKLNSAKELAECIQKIKYRYIGNISTKMNINVSHIKFNKKTDNKESKEIKKLPIEEIVSFCNSEGAQINLLHAAAILNSEELFDRCNPSDHPDMLITPDPARKTPIDWALRMQHYSMAVKLIKELPLTDLDAEKIYEIISSSNVNYDVITLLCDIAPKKEFLEATMKALSYQRIPDETLTYIGKKYPDIAIDGKITGQSIKKALKK